jgi:phage repressor protein C with HTH and peptisase S24 domain
MSTRTWQKWAGGAGLVAAGVVAGGVVASTLTANAADTATPSTSASESTVDPSQPQRPDETLLTGDTKTQVEAAVLAAYPDATIQRTETDSEGVYESHVVTADGQELIVQVGEDFAVTGTETGGHGGHGGPGRGHDGADDDADD